MAATVTFDTLQSSQLQLEGLSGRILRGVTITGIDASAGADPSVILAAQTAVLGSVGATYPGNSNYVFTGLFIRGFTTDGCFGYAAYETFRGGAPSSYVIENTSYINAVEQNTIPAWNGDSDTSRMPIRIGWLDDIDSSFDVPPDNVTMRFQRPTRAISVSGLVYGTPSTTYEDSVGYVNDSDWGPPGRTQLPAGYWMLAKYSDTVSKYSGYYTYQALAITRNFEDWSETGILRNYHTGKFVAVTDAEVTACNAPTYQYGFIYKGNGIVRVGGNPVADFTTIFGF